MSTMPENVPLGPENSSEREAPEFPSAQLLPAEIPVSEPAPAETHEDSHSVEAALIAPSEAQAFEPALFAQYSKEEYRQPARIPHFGHLILLLLLACFGLLGAGSLLLLGMHFHLFGVSTLGEAVTDFRYTLGSQAVQYLITFAACLFVFPLVWRKGFFDGLQWRATTALRLKGRLIATAVACFALAMLNGYFMPGPTDAPIDRIFRAPGAAWVLFAFGVTLAPFFEEIAFRGFFLPALCTAYDWFGEKIAGIPLRPLDENNHPQWSMPAMVVSSILTSLPFALMHAEQTAYSLGPFLLLVGVSLVLCWVRLSTRSLASSVLVHACYNFLLFSLMLFGTGGFKHLDKM